MSQGEFQLIDRYFRALAPGTADSGVALGIGDDCALLDGPVDQQLAVSTDTLVAGRHFPESTDPEAIGHKALAVNLSDLAAMGARPLWATLALSLASADDDWLRGFCRGFGTLAKQHGVALVGGDTTRSSVLSISVTIAGAVKRGQALRRSGAKPGDGIYVSGSVGDAALALRLWQSGQAVPAGCQQRLDLPEPRLALGRALLGVASSCIDISDGLSADLAHICNASGVGAQIDADALPLSAELSARDDGQDLALRGGDDYELCFSVPAEREMMLSLALDASLPRCTRIGQIEAEPGLRLLEQGVVRPVQAAGYDHFAVPD